MKNKYELILNPTENIYNYCPKNDNIKGFYIPQHKRDINARVIFAGRDKYTDQIQNIYKKWNTKLNSSEITISLLSGLHASIILFMSLSNAKSKIMTLPVDAGGHFASKNILARLGYIVEEFVVDYSNHCIDIKKSLIKANKFKPDYIFIARSNYMQYEDFSWLNNIMSNPIKVFDASQCLTGIIIDKYKSPFDMGFDIILASLHKDYPGTQQALCALSPRAHDLGLDTIITKEMPKYISNIHPSEILNSAYFLQEFEQLIEYEYYKIKNAQSLYDSLIRYNQKIYTKHFDNTVTQQIWLLCNTNNEAYNLFKNLENVGILCNYFKLPYRLGHGLRIGTGAATRQGLIPSYCDDLAKIISDCKKQLLKDEMTILNSKTQFFLSQFIKE